MKNSCRLPFGQRPCSSSWVEEGGLRGAVVVVRAQRQPLGGSPARSGCAQPIREEWMHLTHHAIKSVRLTIYSAKSQYHTVQYSTAILTVLTVISCQRISYLYYT